MLCSDASAGRWVTLFYARLDPVSGERTYVHAGHHPALLCRAGAEATNAQEQIFGVERFERVVLAQRTAPRLRSSARRAFAGSEEPFDDLAVVVVKRG